MPKKFQKSPTTEFENWSLEIQDKLEKENFKEKSLSSLLKFVRSFPETYKKIEVVDLLWTQENRKILHEAVEENLDISDFLNEHFLFIADYDIGEKSLMEIIVEIGGPLADKIIPKLWFRLLDREIREYDQVKQNALAYYCHLHGNFPKAITDKVVSLNLQEVGRTYIQIKKLNKSEGRIGKENMQYFDEKMKRGWALIELKNERGINI